MAVFFSSETETAHAAPYAPTFSMKFCNGLSAAFPATITFNDPDLLGNPACADPNPILRDTAYDITTQYGVPAGSANFGSSVFTMFDSTFQVSTDAAVTNGAKVGGLSSVVNLALLNGACATELTVEFVLYDSTTTTGSVGPLAEGTPNRNRPLVTSYTEGTADGVIDTSDDSFIDGYQVIDGQVDIDRDLAITGFDDGTLRTLTVTNGNITVADSTIGDGAGGAVTDITYKGGMVDGIGDEIGKVDSPFVSNKIPFYDILFDPDLDFPGGPNGGLSPVAPRARYTGMARVPAVTGDWQLLTFFQFDPGALKEFNSYTNNRPHSFGRLFRDLGPIANDAFVSLSILNDPTATRISISPIHDFCSPLDVTTMLKGNAVPPAGGSQVRGKTPASGSTHNIASWSYGQRDADNDGKENAFDTCPFTTNNNTDADGDGIDGACDAGVGFASVGDFGQTDVDGDGFANRQDNCPQTVNGTVLQKDGENTQTYLSAGADGGTKTDQIGDSCDGVVSNGCNNGIDDDGDTVANDGPGAGCTGTTQGANPESDTKGDNPTGTGTATVTQGGYNEKIIFIPKCIENVDTDVDNDGYCAAQDINDGDPAIRGFSVNHGPDTDGNSIAIAKRKYRGAQADKYGAADEFYMGTDYYEACGANAWPPDFNNDSKVDAADQALQNAQLGAVTTVAKARFDLVPNKIIDAADQAAVTAALGSLLCTDADGDGFSNADETTITTLTLVPCGVNGWPADFNNDLVIDITDVLTLKPVFGAPVPGVAPFRDDIKPDGVIDISDVLTLKPIFGLVCVIE